MTRLFWPECAVIIFDLTFGLWLTVAIAWRIASAI